MTLLAVLAIIAGIIGIVGSVVPGLPGPPVSWVGMLLAYFAGGTASGGDTMSLAVLIIWLVVTVVVSVLDYVIPAKFTKLTGGSKAASAGALVGLVVGIFLTPVGMILGSLIGAFLAEMFIEDKGASASLKSAFGAFLGFICGTGLKLIASGVMMYYIVVYSF